MFFFFFLRIFSSFVGTCEATIHNSTNAAECKFSNICNGHGNCSMVEGQQCDCDVGWEGDECDETEGGGGLGGGIIFLIVCLSGGAVIGGFFLNVLSMMMTMSERR